MLFAIPFEEDYTLLGTTDVEIDADPGPVAITSEEVDYICAAANEYFEAPVSPGDVVWSYSGIRPLFDDAAANASEVTRDYVRHVDRGPAPLLSVYGGKITTYRRLAEQAVNMLAGPLGCERRGWTRDAPLPGGDIPRRGRRRVHRALRRAPWRGSRRRSCAVTCATTARTFTRSWPDERASAISASTSEPGSTRRRSISWWRTNGRGPRTTFSGDGPKKGLTMPGEGVRRLRAYLRVAAVPADGSCRAGS